MGVICICCRMWGLELGVLRHLEESFAFMCTEYCIDLRSLLSASNMQDFESTLQCPVLARYVCASPAVLHARVLGISRDARLFCGLGLFVCL